MAELLQIENGFFDSEHHRYFDVEKRRIISTTQVFSHLGFIDYDSVREEVLQRKSQIGMAVHAGIEYLVQGQLDWDTVPDEAMGYILCFEDWAKAMQFEVLSCEQSGICEVNGMKFGYRYDLRGKMQYKGRERQVIAELKTCVKESPTWVWQTGAYSLAAPKIGEEYLRVALQLSDTDKAKPFYYEDRNDKNSFLHLLYCAILKINAGFELK